MAFATFSSLFSLERDFHMNNELYHFGVKGMRWGVRRYQNEDGSYTAAGRKRYGLDLDLSDKSRTNVANIRLGEARRRLDVAKSSGTTDRIKLFELKRRERMAKEAIREAKKIEAGARRLEKGENITKNNIKALIAYGAATLASRALTRHLNTRLSDLASAGRVTAGHYRVAAASNLIGGYGAYGLATAYSMKKEHDNSKIRSYYNARNMGNLGLKRFGSIEYEDRLRRAKQES